MADRELSARIPVRLPKQGWTMEVGSIVEWRKRDGDPVRRGEILFVIQSDKATNEIEALENGILRIPADSPPIGQEVPIGTVVAYIEPAEVADERPEVASPDASRRIMSPAWGQVSGQTDASRSLPPVGEGQDEGVLDSPHGGRPHPSPLPEGEGTQQSREARPTVRATVAQAPVEAPSIERVLDLYRTMLKIRRTEEALARAHQNGLVHGACHTYVGEEAIATGVCAHLTHADPVFSTHRGHGHALAKGVEASELAAELLGRATGCSGGRGGSMHIFKPEVGMMGTSGIVGPSILLATGAGYQAKLLRTGQVGVVFFGDGASNNGAFHEGLNLASIWDLPVLFVCENNLYATEVPFRAVAREPDIAARAGGYGIPGVVVDGNDVLAVYETAGEALRRARAGHGPTLLECKTYRTRAHSEGMREAGYRSIDEIESWKARDPIAILRRTLLRGGVPDAQLAELDRAAEREADAAIEFARNSPFPDPSTVMDNVYAE